MGIQEDILQSEQERRNDERLRITTGTDESADRAGRLLEMQMQTGLPAEFVDRNLDQVESAVKRKQFDPVQFRKESPVFAKWAAENPHNPALVSDDFEKLKGLEWAAKAIGAAHKEGWATVEMSKIGAEAMNSQTGQASPEGEKRLQELQSLYPGEQMYGATNWFEKFLIEGVRMLPTTEAAGKEALTMGLGTASGFAGIAAAAGQMGPQVATPEEIVTVPAAAALGMTIGMATGAGQAVDRMEAGLAYLELRDIKDENGEPIPPGMAKAAAQMVGIVNAGLETLGLGKIAKHLGGERLVNTYARKAVAAALKKATFRDALLKFAGRYAETFGTNVTQEVLQEASNVLADEIVKSIAPGDFQHTTTDEAANRLADVAVKTAEAMAFTALPGPALRFVGDAKRVQTANQRQAVFESLAENAKDSKVRERSPAKFREYMKRLADDGSVDTIRVPVERFNEYFQSINVDPAEAARQITGSDAAYTEASAAGTDVEIKLEDFAQKVAPNHFEGLANDLRVNPDDMTFREAQDWAKNSDEVMSELTRSLPASVARSDAYQTIHEDVTGQLIASGMERDTAERNATLMANIFATLGERTAQDPTQLYKRYGLRIMRDMPEILKAVGRINPAIDSLVDRLRAGDIPTDRQIHGQSLADFLKEKGGVQDHGGELAQMATKTKIRGLVKQDGMTLDQAVEAAFEAGYIEQNDNQQFMDALSAEVDGSPTFTGNATNDQLLQLKMALDELDHYLTEQKIDINTVTNDEIRALLYPQGTEFKQATQGDRRASIVIDDATRHVTINLSVASDLSSFLHESGHLYLEVLGDLAEASNTPDQITQDYAAVLNWLGVDNRQAIGTDQHEQFARAFEAYLFEGKAPTPELQSAFSRFRAWLISIYRKLSDLNVKINPSIRGVFDRLVATDDAIANASESQNYVPLFTNAEAAGMTPEQFQAYRKHVEQARIEAEESLSQKILSVMQREQKAWWKGERAKIREAVATEVHQMPVYKALAFLQKGKAPDGSEIDQEHVRLSKADLVERYGKDFLKRLPRPYVYQVNGGVSAEQVALRFGYRSGDEMVQDIANARNMNRLINAETDARMNVMYPDPMTDGSLVDQSINAVHSEKRAELLSAELRTLRKLARRDQPAVKAARLADARHRREAIQANRGQLPNADDLAIIKMAARQMIDGKRVRDLNPALYRTAEARAARKAFEAAGKGNFEIAYAAKRGQILNHELYRAVVHAKEKVERIATYMRKFDKNAVRTRIGKAGHLEQIDSIRARFDFSRITNIAARRRVALAEWVEQQKENGFEVNLPQQVLDETQRTPYKELTFSEVEGIYDSVRNIEHLSRLKNKLLSAAFKRQFNETVDGIVESIDENHKRNKDAPDYVKHWSSRIKSNVKSYFAEHTKAEFLFLWLDGEKEGGSVWRALFKPLADAENVEQKMQREARDKLREVFSSYERDDLKQMFTKPRYVQEVDTNFTHASLLAVALNTGNTYNRDVLMRGTGWSEMQLEAVLSYLTDADWDTVQKAWDYIDSYWGPVAELQREMTGVRPKKVQAVPFTTKNGRKMRGGYYPIEYDGSFSERQLQHDEKQSTQELFGGHYARAATRQGHTKARTDSGGKPIKLDLGVLTNHVTNVIHDLTHRKAILDVNRLIDNKKVQIAIIETAGREMYRQLKPWLRTIASDYRQPMNTVEKLLNRARAGGTVVNMGVKITTAIVQPLGFLQTVDLLGEKYSLIGLKEFYGNGIPYESQKRALNFILERSEQIRNRMRTFDRDVRDQLKGVARKDLNVRRAFFFLTGLGDMSVSVPSWLGAYRKAMDGKVEGIKAGHETQAIDFADSIVRRSQGAGSAKDLSGIQTGHPLMKLFTMFYSYFNVLYNLMARRTKMTKWTSPASVAHFAASMMYLWFLPAVLSEIIAGRGPDRDKGETWAQWSERTFYLWGLYPLYSLIGVRDVANALGPYDYEASPAFSALAETAKALLIPYKAFAPDEEVTRSDIKAAAMAVSYWGALPGRQMWITGSYLYDWMTGKDEPDDVAEALRNLAYSRRK